MKSNEIIKVVFIVDGLNLFHSVVNTLGLQNSLIDIEKLCKTIILKNEEIKSIDYFTSYFKEDSHTAILQRKLIRKNSNSKIINLNFGLLRPRSIICKYCFNEIKYFKEKYTDVNIAVKLMEKFNEPNLKKIYFISADTDFAPLIQKLSNQLNVPKIVRVSPIGRFNSSDSTYIHLKKNQLLKSRF